MRVRFRALRWGVLIGSVVALSACGLWGGSKTSSRTGLAFPVATSAPVDPWATGMVPGRGAESGQSALSINPFDPIALNNLAVAEAARGRYQQALSLLQRAVKLAPARADIAANLGNMQRWLAQAEGQAALGLTPQPLQLPYQDNNTVPAVPPLWVEPGRSPVPTAGASRTPNVVPVAR